MDRAGRDRTECNLLIRRRVELTRASSGSHPPAKEQPLRAPPVNPSSSRTRGSRRLAKAMTRTRIPVRRWVRANAGRLLSVTCLWRSKDKSPVRRAEAAMAFNAAKQALAYCHLNEKCRSPLSSERHSPVIPGFSVIQASNWIRRDGVAVPDLIKPPDSPFYRSRHHCGAGCYKPLSHGNRNWAAPSPADNPGP